MKLFYKICSLAATVFLFAISSIAQNINGNWSIVGPVAFPTNFSGQIHGIGRVSQIKFHATNAQKMYAVSASGGLWISTNGGTNWNKTGTDNQLPQTSCASVCVDYSNENIIYLGTGDANYYSEGYGIYKSTNGGSTWTASNSGIGTRMAVEILMSPTDHNTLIAATSDGIWKSTNAGVNWTQKKIGSAFKAMVYQPGSSLVMYAVDDATFWRSTNGGDNWNQIASVNPVAGNGGRIAVSAANANTVYVSFVGSNTASAGTNAKGGIIYRSTDGGVNFTLRKGDVAPNLAGYGLNATASWTGQGDYDWGIFADRLNANTLYVCGHVVWRSTDGGANWVDLTDWWTNCHTDMHQIITSPYDNTKLFNVNDGGIFLSTDGGNNWNPSANGLSATEVYHMGQSNLTRNTVGIGTQDNGELYFNTNTWYTNRGGDWGSAYAFDYANANTAYYGENGKRQDLLLNNGDVSTGLTGNSNDDRYVMTPQNTSLAYVSQGTKLKRTKNLLASPPSWKSIKTFTAAIKAVAVSPTNSEEVYVVLNNNQVYYSSNAFTSNTPSFVPVGAAPVSTYDAANISVNKNNTSIVYMTCGSKVYRSVNKAVNWTDITGIIPNTNILGLVHDPFSTNESFYVATAFGVYYRNATLGAWQVFSNGLPTIAQITELRGFFDGTANSTLRVAFYGRGVWQSPLYSNGAAACTNVNLKLVVDSYPEETSWTIKDANGITVKSGGVYTGTVAGTTINETACLPNGCYTFTINDVYGDGICCAYGNGSYTLTTGASTIKTGGTFAASEATNFCIPYPDPAPKPAAAIALAETFSNEITIVPNPAVNNATIKINASKQGIALINVADVSGKVLVYRKQELQKGNNSIVLDVQPFAVGTYFVVVKMDGKLITKKLMVIK